MSGKKNALIWKLESGDKDASYLIGTMHVKDAAAFSRVNDMYAAIDACEVFATEFNLEEADHNLTAETMDLKNGQTLQSLVGKKRFKKMAKRVEREFGLDISLFNGSLPLLLSNMLTEQILSDDMQHSLDESLYRYAKEQEKTTLGVETFLEQMEILGKIPIDIQVKQLKDMLGNLGAYRKHVRKLAKAYRQEEIGKLYKATKKSMGSLRKLMIYDRNERMAERMVKMMQETSCCFAVGAAHLDGGKGILRKLKHSGITLSAI